MREMRDNNRHNVWRIIGMQLLRLACMALVVVSSALGMWGCDGGGGDGGGGQNAPPPTAVTVQGQVDDGTPNSPIANAQCQAVDLQGRPIVSTTADTNGLFQVDIPPGTDTFIGCSPQALRDLIL